MLDDTSGNENQQDDAQEQKQTHRNGQEIMDHISSEPTEFPLVQLSDVEQRVGIQTSSERHPGDRDEEGDQQHQTESTRRRFGKEQDEAKVVEITHTGLDAEHEDEEEVDEEHQDAGTGETTCLCCIRLASVDRHAECDVEDEQHRRAARRDQWQKLIVADMGRWVSEAHDRRMNDNDEKAKNGQRLEDKGCNILCIECAGAVARTIRCCRLW